MDGTLRSPSPVKRHSDYSELPDVDGKLPIGDPVIDRCADRFDIGQAELRTALERHQTDLQTEGTVFGFVQRLVEEGNGKCLYYTDWAIYLSIDADVWEREKNWFDIDEAVFEGVQKAHTVEVDRVMNSLDTDGRANDAGYVIYTPFPLRTVAVSEHVGDELFTVAERAEFLERDTGIKRKGAVCYALFESVRNSNDCGAEDAIKTVADVFEMEYESVEEIITRVSEWGLKVSSVLNDLDESVDDNTMPAGDIFGTVAAARTEQDQT